MKIFTTFISIFLGLIFGALVLKMTGISPVEAYSEMWNGVFAKPHYISTVIVRSTPLIFTGLAVAFAFKTGLFNIGAEGQFIIGSLSATVLGIYLDLPAFLMIPTVLILSMIMAGLYAALAGYLKARYGVHEVLTCIMLNWIALYFSNWALMSTAIHRPHTETSEFIKPTASITILEEWKISDAGMEFFAQYPWLQQFMRSPVNMGIILAIIVCLIIWFILSKTTFGYELKAVGFNQNASRYGGINVKKRLTQSMFISGLLAGAAGATQVMGVSKNVAMLAGPEGYGFEGIAVSLIGMNHPFGVVVSGLFLGALKYSGQKLQSILEAPSEVITLMIGVIVLFIALEPFIVGQLKKLKKKEVQS